MAKLKKSTSIPMVDALKAGIDPDVDPYKNLRGESGKILMVPSNKLDKIRSKQYQEHIAEEEARLEKLKSMAGITTSKKDKKKKASIGSMFESDTLSFLGTKRTFGEDEYEEVSEKKKKKKKKKKKDKKKKKKDKGNEISKVKLSGLTIKEKVDKKTGEKKQISIQDQIAARFKDVEKLTQDNIKTIDETLKTVDDRLSRLTSEDAGRVRGQETAIANYIQAKSTLINARQSAAKDILSVRTKAIDIEMKKENANGAGGNDPSTLIARLLPEMVGNKNFKNNIADTIASNGKNKDKKNKKKKHSDEDEDRLSKRIKQLEKSGDLEYNNYDKNIEYEGKFTTAIKKSWSTGEWKFIGLDNTGRTVDVPKALLPSKKTCDMQFDDEKDMAIDRNRGLSYRVIQVPSL